MSTTREECVADAGAAYGAILADPIRSQQIRKARAEHEARTQTAAGEAAAGSPNHDSQPVQRSA